MSHGLGYAMLATISTWHVVVVLIIVLLLFGGKKLPELARGLGKGMRIFRDELHGIQKDINEKPEEPPAANKPQDKPAEPMEKDNPYRKT